MWLDPCLRFATLRAGGSCPALVGLVCLLVAAMAASTNAAPSTQEFHYWVPYVDRTGGPNGFTSRVEGCAVSDATRVEFDLDHDGAPDRSILLNRGDAFSEAGVQQGSLIASSQPLEINYLYVFKDFGAYEDGTLAYSILPGQSLGTDYWIPLGANRLSVLSLVDGNTIHVDTNNDGLPEHTAVLARGQSARFSVGAGTHLWGDHPFQAVAVNIADNHYDRSFAYSVLPTDRLGTRLLAPHGHAHSYQAAVDLSTVHVVATEDASDVVIGGESRTLGAGDVWAYRTTQGAVITASKPIMGAFESRIQGRDPWRSTVRNYSYAMPLLPEGSDRYTFSAAAAPANSQGRPSHELAIASFHDDTTVSFDCGPNGTVDHTVVLDRDEWLYVHESDGNVGCWTSNSMTIAATGPIQVTRSTRGWWLQIPEATWATALFSGIIAADPCVADTDCDDGSSCTADVCDPTSRTCVYDRANEEGTCGVGLGRCRDGQCVPTPVEPRSDVDLLTVCRPLPPCPDGVVRCDIHVQNRGPSPLPQLSVTMELSGDLQIGTSPAPLLVFRGSSSTGAIGTGEQPIVEADGHRAEWSARDVPAGGKAATWFTLDVGQVGGDKLVTATGSLHDPTPANNSDTEPIAPEADLCPPAEYVQKSGVTPRPDSQVCATDTIFYAVVFQSPGATTGDFVDELDPCLDPSTVSALMPEAECSIAGSRVTCSGMSLDAGGAGQVSFAAKPRLGCAVGTAIANQALVSFDGGPELSDTTTHELVGCEQDCRNGVDDDGDGAADCADSDCQDRSCDPGDACLACNAGMCEASQCHVCESVGDVTCDDVACDLFDVIGAIDQAIDASPRTCEADVNCSCDVDIFDVICLIDCALRRPDHCLVERCSPEGCLEPTCADGPARVGESALWGAFDETPTIRIEAPGRAGRHTEHATLVVRPGGTPLRGLAFTLEVPPRSSVETIQTAGISGDAQAAFHQSGGQLRVLLVSHDGSPITTREEARLTFTLRESPGKHPSPWTLRVLEAEAADAYGQPVAFDLPNPPQPPGPTLLRER